MPVTPIETPFGLFTGSTVSSDVPSLWPMALAGRNYMIDTINEDWHDNSIPLLRPQQDAGSTPAEQSLNPDVMWRRAGESWHGGAGQAYRDRLPGDELAPFRYRSSKGVDPWEPFELSLLNGTDQKTSTANTNLKLMPAGTRLYTTSGQTTTFTTDITAGSPSFTTVTGTPAATASGIASDGKYVYLAYSASGIYLTNTGSTAAASWITGTVGGPIAYVKGRLMAANGASIYNITTSTGTAGPTALPTPLFTKDNDGFTWVGFADGQSAIYAAGFAGDKSTIYRISLKPDGTALDAPVVAGELPDGEIVRTIEGYLGFIFLGTEAGVRFCIPDGDGSLQIGAPFGPPSAVYAFEGQDRFVWFGWTGYDASSTGLGRCSLRTFTEDTVSGARTPAYASDLMVTGSGQIVDVCTFNDIRVFTVSGSGVWAEDTSTLVASGTLESGTIGWGVPDQKLALSVETRSQPLDGSYTIGLKRDQASTFTTIGSQDTADSTYQLFTIEQGDGRDFELQLTLTRAVTVTLGPIFLRYTLKASPGGTDSPAEYLFVPILLHHKVTLPNGQEMHVDVDVEKENLKALRRTRERVTAQIGSKTYTVQMEGFHFQARNFYYKYGTLRGPDGVMTVQLKRVDSQENI